MDLSQAITILEAMTFTPMTPLEMADLEQFRYAEPRPTYRDIAQILAMLERFDLVRREGIGDSTTSEWRQTPVAKGIRSVAALQQYMSEKLGSDSDLSDLEQHVLDALAAIGGRSDLPTINARMPGGPTTETDSVFQAIAELQGQGLVALSWGQTVSDWPYLRLTRKGWLKALTGR